MMRLNWIATLAALAFAFSGVGAGEAHRQEDEWGLNKRIRLLEQRVTDLEVLAVGASAEAGTAETARPIAETGLGAAAPGGGRRAGAICRAPLEKWVQIGTWFGVPRTDGTVAPDTRQAQRWTATGVGKVPGDYGVTGPVWAHAPTPEAWARAIATNTEGSAPVVMIEEHEVIPWAQSPLATPNPLGRNLTPLAAHWRPIGEAECEDWYSW